MSHEEL